jgi:HEAT repeat protein
VSAVRGEAIHVLEDSLARRDIHEHRYVIAFEAPPNASLRIASHAIAGGRRTARRRLTGDASFDGEFAVGGDAMRAVAILDDVLRTQLIALTLFGGRLDCRISAQSQIAFTAPHLVRGHEAALLRTNVEALGQAMIDALEGRIEERLLANAEQSADAGVRRKSLRVLLECFGSSAEAVRAAPLALKEAGILRILGAALVREPGFAILRSIVESDANPDKMRIEALKRLVRLLHPPDAHRAIASALASRCQRLRSAAIVLAVRTADPLLADRLLRIASTQDPATAIEIVNALEENRCRSSERWLIALFERRDGPVKAAVVDALARVGTIDSVAPLLRGTRGMLADRRLKTAARRAVKLIQGRALGKEAGSLSLVDGAASEGGLSFAARGGSGALSIPDGFGSPSEARRRACPADNAPGPDGFGSPSEARRRACPADNAPGPNDDDAQFVGSDNIQRPALGPGGMR